MRPQVKLRSTILNWWHTMRDSLPGGIQGALGEIAAKQISSVPFCLPYVHIKWTFLDLHTSFSLTPKLSQVFSTDPIEPSIPDSAQLPHTNPLLHGPIADLQQFGYFMRRIHPSHVCDFWQNSGLFLGGWHRKQCPFRVVSLVRYSINLTEELCTPKLPLKRTTMYKTMSMKEL